MSDTNEFLPFLINEEIYVIDTQKERPSEVVHEKTVTTNSLVSAPVSVAEPKVELTPPEKPSNEILVIFDNPLAKNLPVGEIEYLAKILGAIGKSTERADFQNVAATSPKASGYKYVIAFTPNHQLPVAASTQQYVPVPLGEGQLIIADALNNIAASTELRKNLWGVLQQVFK